MQNLDDMSEKQVIKMMNSADTIIDRVEVNSEGNLDFYLEAFNKLRIIVEIAAESDTLRLKIRQWI